MTTEANVKTRCPICSAKYRVPSSAVGHRAQCSQCKATFRVHEVESSRLHPPTEEDILAWLNEGRDDDLFDHEENARDYRRPAEPRPVADQGKSSVTSRPLPHASPNASQPDRRSRLHTDQNEKILQFRKTG